MGVVAARTEKKTGNIKLQRGWFGRVHVMLEIEIHEWDTNSGHDLFDGLGWRKATRDERDVVLLNWNLRAPAPSTDGVA